MSNYSDLFDVLKISRTVLVGKGKNIVALMARSPEPQPGDEGAPSETEGEEVESWQHYGFVSKPPKDADMFILRLGRFVASIATRAVDHAKTYGLLSDGDVGLYSVGKQLLRLNADGSSSFLKETKNGEHLLIQISADDEIKIVHPAGAYVEISKDRMVFKHDTAPITIASGVKVQIVAPQLINLVGSNSLSVAAVKPLEPSSTAPNVFT